MSLETPYKRNNSKTLKQDILLQPVRFDRTEERDKPTENHVERWRNSYTLHLVLIMPYFI